MNGLLIELRRRNVFRVGLFYLASAWLVLQVGDVVLGLLDAPAAVLRLVAVLLAVGFPLVLILAWVFEITPAGIRWQSDVDGALERPAWAGRRLDVATIAVAATAAALLVWVYLERAGEPVAGLERVPAAQSVPADHSIVVLPFVNMSPDPAQEYFSDGISEELLNVLTQVPELRVISRTSAFSFKNRSVQAQEISRQLNVAHILEGSVRTAGDQVRITAQLIDARTDTHLWSATYDRSLEDIFAIQDEIARMVVDQLRVNLLGEPPRVAATDPEAYGLYLQARDLASRGSAEANGQAVVLLERVLAIDPEYAPAWESLSGVYSNQAGRGYRPLDEGYALAREMAWKALEIDPGHGPAYARLGWIAMTHDNDLSAAARHFERALELAPTHLGVLSNSAVLLQSLGRMESAIALMEAITARNPVSTGSQYNLGYYYLATGRLDEAIERYRTSLRMSPERIGAHYFIGVALLLQGKGDAAMVEMEQEPHPVMQLLGRAMAHHALGQFAESDAALDRVMAEHSRGWAYYIASVLAFHNRSDAAFEWLEQAVEYGNPGLPGIIINPLFAPVHEDPRWLPLLESIGKTPEQLDAIAFRVPPPP